MNARLFEWWVPWAHMGSRNWPLSHQFSANTCFIQVVPWIIPLFHTPVKPVRTVISDYPPNRNTSACETHPVSFCLTISLFRPLCLPWTRISIFTCDPHHLGSQHTVFPPSTTNRSSWKNWLITVCLCSCRVSHGSHGHLTFEDAPLIHPYRESSTGTLWCTHLQCLELLQALLHQLLNLSLVLHILMFPEWIPRPALRILSEVVCRKLFALP